MLNIALDVLYHEDLALKKWIRSINYLVLSFVILVISGIVFYKFNRVEE